MNELNLEHVNKLISSRDFARDVDCYYQKASKLCGDMDSLLYYAGSELRDVIDMRASFNKNFVDIRKSVCLARDIIKMNNYKRVVRGSRFDHYLNDRSKVYPRPTANDVYVRDYEAEQEELDYRWSCCMPYDCMHYENASSPVIYTKVEVS